MSYVMSRQALPELPHEVGVDELDLVSPRQPLPLAHHVHEEDVAPADGAED